MGGRGAWESPNVSASFSERWDPASIKELYRYTWTFKGVSWLEIPDDSGLGRNQPGDPFEGAGMYLDALIACVCVFCESSKLILYLVTRNLAPQAFCSFPKKKSLK